MTKKIVGSLEWVQTIEVPANWELNIRPKRKKRTEKFWRSYHQNLQRLSTKVRVFIEFWNTNRTFKTRFWLSLTVRSFACIWEFDSKFTWVYLLSVFTECIYMYWEYLLSWYDIYSMMFYARDDSSVKFKHFIKQIKQNYRPYKTINQKIFSIQRKWRYWNYSILQNS